MTTDFTDGTDGPGFIRVIREIRGDDFRFRLAALRNTKANAFASF
jgi:hypothetical protein